MKFIDYRQDLEVELKSFDKNLIKMNKSDFLPRYNRLIVTITNNSDQTIDFLFLNVRRADKQVSLWLPKSNWRTVSDFFVQIYLLWVINVKKYNTNFSFP